MQVRWSLDAIEDLDNLFEYIAEDSVDNAMQFVLKIRERANDLAFDPKQGVEIPELNDERFRKLYYKGYAIVYEIQENSILVHEVYNQYRKFVRTFKLKYCKGVTVW